MKIKGSSKINFSSLFAVFVCVTVPAVVIRTFQVFTLIDVSTGFYKEKSIFTVILYALIIVSCTAFCVLSFVNENSAGIVADEIENKKLCAVTYMFAVSMIFDFLKSLFSGMNGLGSAEAAQGASFLKGIISSGLVMNIFRGVFAALSALYFFYLASSVKSGSSKASKHKLLALAPVGWTTFRLIGLFVSKISFLQVSDLFLEIVMLCFMTMFFMSLAQSTSGVYSEGSGWKLPAYGFSSALIAGVLSVSRLVGTVAGSEKYITAGHPFEIADLFFCIFAAVYVFVVTREYNLLFDRSFKEEKAGSEE